MTKEEPLPMIELSEKVTRLIRQMSDLMIPAG